MEHQCKVDSDYYTMESSKSRSSRFFSPSTTRKHNRKSRKENEISVISPKRGLKVNSGYQKQQQQQQQRQDCYCVHGQSCHTCSTRGEGVIIEESAAKTHNVLGESCDTSHNAGQWSKVYTYNRIDWGCTHIFEILEIWPINHINVLIITRGSEL